MCEIYRVCDVWDIHDVYCHQSMINMYIMYIICMIDFIYEIYLTYLEYSVYNIYIKYIRKGLRNMCVVLCLMNEKGGVGKSTLTFSAAWELGKAGRKVLLIDMDGQQANLTYLSGVEHVKYTMADVLTKNVDPADAVVSVGRPCDTDDKPIAIIPANSDMVNLSQTVKITRMKKTIEALKKDYDCIFLDVSPSPDWRHALVLSVLDQVHIVVNPDVMSLEAITGMMESITEVQESGVNSKLKIGHFILNEFDQQSNLGKDVYERLVSLTKDYVQQKGDGPIIVRKSVAVKEAALQHIGIRDYRKPKTENVKSDVYMMTERLLRW